ncbi:hypothetical protein R3P38DRAFT_3226989 [Favolaschia claudopus]|uniref:Uncharacterized protein n=1 Tax=Favolaschia claudopus TaxID=2862362 RepID=A0AAV9ZU01_9AGAR
MTTPRRAKSLPASSPVSISSSEPSPIKRDIKPVGGQTARHSSFEQGMAKARSHKPRQTFEESLIGLQREMMVAANAREDVKLQHAREKIRMKEIDQLMKMHSLTTEILGERIKIVNAKYEEPPTPVKRRRSISPVAGSSKRHRYTASSSSFLGGTPELARGVQCLVVTCDVTLLFLTLMSSTRHDALELIRHTFGLWIPQDFFFLRRPTTRSAAG